MAAVKNDTKKIFWKKGTCSQTFYYILNREFGDHNEVHELASDPLVGGIMQLGHQCGLLMGSTLAVGKTVAQAYADHRATVSIPNDDARSWQSDYETASSVPITP